MNSELYWAAGFFDGEGCIRFGPQSTSNKLLQFELYISQTRREPLERFQKAVGQGKVYGPKKNRSYQPVFYFRISNRYGVKQVAEMLLPLVSVPKQEQITRVLEVEKLNPARHRWGGH